MFTGAPALHGRFAQSKSPFGPTAVRIVASSNKHFASRFPARTQYARLARVMWDTGHAGNLKSASVRLCRLTRRMTLSASPRPFSSFLRPKRAPNRNSRTSVINNDTQCETLFLMRKIVNTNYIPNSTPYILSRLINQAGKRYNPSSTGKETIIHPNPQLLPSSGILPSEYTFPSFMFSLSAPASRLICGTPPDIPTLDVLGRRLFLIVHIIVFFFPDPT